MAGGGGGAAAKGSSGGVRGVRIVVSGDRGTGKSSLIVTAAAETFPINVPPLLPPTRLPEDMYPDRVPVTIIDTSSRFLSLDNLIFRVFLCFLCFKHLCVNELCEANACFSVWCFASV